MVNNLSTDLESDITGEQDSDTGVVLCGAETEVGGDTGQFGRCDILTIKVITEAVSHELKLDRNLLTECRGRPKLA